VTHGFGFIDPAPADDYSGVFLVVDLGFGFTIGLPASDLLIRASRRMIHRSQGSY